MAQFKYFDLSWFKEREYAPGVDGKCANHFMLLHHLVHSKSSPVVLECGSAQGRSTCTMLSACEAVNGRLYSVDINDHSDSAISDRWQFIQSDDRNIEYILEQAPGLKNGIDILFIDSVHTRAHVQTLLERWFPLVKQDGFIAFHDIDPTPYKLEGRTPNLERYLAYSDMSEFIKEFFHANDEHLFLAYHFGITGMGIMKKISPMGTQPKPPLKIRDWPNAPGVTASARLLVNALGRYVRANILRRSP